ncbi:hypothetical protein [Emticicia sp. BO119]|uniref:hypothetical protein n=1 Tax=Emticicia sp. BO119 TaxID=2757768 RepID=UPI0015F01A54|nr:hypothetical protein [Emticicia sp. BO119]MBA4853760.1 hypothetical protein [Emticicia sp. BO119]
MVSTLALIVSVFALGATWRQLHLQRTHNHKSLKPIGQIDFGDRNFSKHLFIYLNNFGVGPMIVTKLIFEKNGIKYEKIADCMEIESKKFMHVNIHSELINVILPGKYIEIFETKDPSYSDEKAIYNVESMNVVKRQLAEITLTVEYKDVYDNEYTTKRSFDWFIRHIKNTNDLTIQNKSQSQEKKINENNLIEGETSIQSFPIKKRTRLKKNTSQ